MKNCPICGRKLIRDRYYDEVGIVERDERCPYDHYINSWAYGNQYLKVGKWKAEFTDHKFVSGKDVNIAQRYWWEFTKRLKFARKRGK